MEAARESPMEDSPTRSMTPVTGLASRFGRARLFADTSSSKEVWGKEENNNNSSSPCSSPVSFVTGASGVTVSLFAAGGSGPPMVRSPTESHEGKKKASHRGNGDQFRVNLLQRNLFSKQNSSSSTTSASNFLTTSEGGGDSFAGGGGCASSSSPVSSVDEPMTTTTAGGTPSPPLLPFGKRSLQFRENNNLSPLELSNQREAAAVAAAAAAAAGGGGANLDASLLSERSTPPVNRKSGIVVVIGAGGGNNEDATACQFSPNTNEIRSIVGAGSNSSKSVARDLMSDSRSVNEINNLNISMNNSSKPSNNNNNSSSSWGLPPLPARPNSGNSGYDPQQQQVQQQLQQTTSSTSSSSTQQHQSRSRRAAQRPHLQKRTSSCSPRDPSITPTSRRSLSYRDELITMDSSFDEGGRIPTPTGTVSPPAAVSADSLMLIGGGGVAEANNPNFLRRVAAQAIGACTSNSHFRSNSSDALGLYSSSLDKSMDSAGFGGVPSTTTTVARSLWSSSPVQKSNSVDEDASLDVWRERSGAVSGAGYSGRSSAGAAAAVTASAASGAPRKVSDGGSSASTGVNQANINLEELSVTGGEDGAWTALCSPLSPALSVDTPGSESSFATQSSSGTAARRLMMFSVGATSAAMASLPPPAESGSSSEGGDCAVADRGAMMMRLMENTNSNSNIAALLAPPACAAPSLPQSAVLLGTCQCVRPQKVGGVSGVCTHCGGNRPTLLIDSSSNSVSYVNNNSNRMRRVTSTSNLSLATAVLAHEKTEAGYPVSPPLRNSAGGIIPVVSSSSYSPSPQLSRNGSFSSVDSVSKRALSGEEEWRGGITVYTPDPKRARTPSSTPTVTSPYFNDDDAWSASGLPGRGSPACSSTPTGAASAAAMAGRSLLLLDRTSLDSNDGFPYTSSSFNNNTMNNNNNNNAALLSHSGEAYVDTDFVGICVRSSIPEDVDMTGNEEQRAAAAAAAAAFSSGGRAADATPRPRKETMMKNAPDSDGIDHRDDDARWMKKTRSSDHLASGSACSSPSSVSSARKHRTNSSSSSNGNRFQARASSSTSASSSSPAALASGSLRSLAPPTSAAPPLPPCSIVPAALTRPTIGDDSNDTAVPPTISAELNSQLLAVPPVRPIAKRSPGSSSSSDSGADGGGGGSGGNPRAALAGSKRGQSEKQGEKTQVGRRGDAAPHEVSTSDSDSEMSDGDHSIGLLSRDDSFSVARSPRLRASVDLTPAPSSRGSLSSGMDVGANSDLSFLQFHQHFQQQQQQQQQQEQAEQMLCHSDYVIHSPHVLAEEELGEVDDQALPHNMVLKKKNQTMGGDSKDSSRDKRLGNDEVQFEMDVFSHDKQMRNSCVEYAAATAASGMMIGGLGVPPRTPSPFAMPPAMIDRTMESLSMKLSQANKGQSGNRINLPRQQQHQHQHQHQQYPCVFVHDLSNRLAAAVPADRFQNSAAAACGSSFSASASSTGVSATIISNCSGDDDVECNENCCYDDETDIKSDPAVRSRFSSITTERVSGGFASPSLMDDNDFDEKSLSRDCFSADSPHVSTPMRHLMMNDDENTKHTFSSDVRGVSENRFVPVIHSSQKPSVTATFAANDGAAANISFDSAKGSSPISSSFPVPIPAKKSSGGTPENPAETVTPTGAFGGVLPLTPSNGSLPASSLVASQPFLSPSQPFDEAEDFAPPPALIRTNRITGDIQPAAAGGAAVGESGNEMSGNGSTHRRGAFRPLDLSLVNDVSSAPSSFVSIHVSRSCSLLSPTGSSVAGSVSCYADDEGSRQSVASEPANLNMEDFLGGGGGGEDDSSQFRLFRRSRSNGQSRGRSSSSASAGRRGPSLPPPPPPPSVIDGDDETRSSLSSSVLNAITPTSSMNSPASFSSSLFSSPTGASVPAIVYPPLVYRRAILNPPCGDVCPHCRATIQTSGQCKCDLFQRTAALLRPPPFVAPPVPTSRSSSPSASVESHILSAPELTGRSAAALVATTMLERRGSAPMSLGAIRRSYSSGNVSSIFAPAVTTVNAASSCSSSRRSDRNGRAAENSDEEADDEMMDINNNNNNNDEEEANDNNNNNNNARLRRRRGRYAVDDDNDSVMTDPATDGMSDGSCSPHVELTRSSSCFCPDPSTSEGSEEWVPFLDSFLCNTARLRSITTTGMLNLLRGGIASVPNAAGIIIIDCRFEYEYEGGHIQSAINIRSKEQIVSQILNAPHLRFGESHSPRPYIIVFHCEFSANRGPELARHLRSEDRKLNTHRYPHVYFPEVYLLKGGYRAFYSNGQGEFCEPRAYVRMRDRDHRDDYYVSMREYREAGGTFRDARV